MEWRRASPGDAARMAAFVTEVSDTLLNEDQAADFLGSWQVEIAEHGDSIEAAVCVLPPSSAHRRGYAAMWHRHQRNDHPDEVADHLVRLAGSTPHLQVLQIALPADDVLRADRLTGVGFTPEYPLWTMEHDNVTWPTETPVPDGLRSCEWSEVSFAAFYIAYEKAYGDQRLVEPHSAETWSRLSSDGDSPTRAQEIYLRNGFQVSQHLIAYHLHLPGSRPV